MRRVMLTFCKSEGRRQMQVLEIKITVAFHTTLNILQFLSKVADYKNLEGKE